MLSQHDTDNLDTGVDRPPADRDERDGQRRSAHRTAAVIVGGLFIAGDIAGVLGGVVTAGILDEPIDLVRVASHHDRLVIGALCVMAMGFFLAAIPVVMYPILRAHHPVLATGFVLLRGAVETVTYVATAAAWLLLAALGRDSVTSGSADAASSGTVARLLVKTQGSIAPDTTAIVFSLGALVFAFALYQTRLVPRWLSMWGIVGAVAYLAAPVLSLLGHAAGYLMAPLAVQEIVLAVWLIANGFDAVAVGAETAPCSRPIDAPSSSG